MGPRIKKVLDNINSYLSFPLVIIPHQTDFSFRTYLSINLSYLGARHYGASHLLSE
jgi:hypothetical protein